MVPRCPVRPPPRPLLPRFESVRTGLLRFVEGCTSASLLQYDLFSCLPDEYSGPCLDLLANMVQYVVMNAGDVLYGPDDVQHYAYLVNQVRRVVPPPPTLLSPHLPCPPASAAVGHAVLH